MSSTAIANAPAAVVPGLTTAQRAKFAASISIAIQDANGGNCYSNERALIGFLEARKYLYLTEAWATATKAVGWDPVDLTEFGKVGGIGVNLGPPGAAYRTANVYLRDDASLATVTMQDFEYTKILAMNFHTLLAAGLDADNAFMAAALRARYCLIGAYHITANDNLLAFNEVVLVDAKNLDPVLAGICTATTSMEALEALGAEKLLLLSKMDDPDSGSVWVVSHADNIWAAAEHCFRVRSHHFKTGGSDKASYELLYSTYLKACYEGNFSFPKGINMFDVFHTAIHPFKIKALPVLTAHMAWHGLVAQSGIMRMSGSPCGNAVITTTHAALDTMSSEVWFQSFKYCYREQLSVLNAATAYIMDHKYACHISHRLYGMARVTNIMIDGNPMSLEDIKSVTQSIAAAGQGMINALAKVEKEGLISAYALKNAKALEKAAAANPMLAVKIASLVLKAVDSINEEMTLSEVLKTAFPVIAMQPAQAASSTTTMVASNP